MDLDMHEKKVNEVRAQDLARFIDHHYPDAAVNDDVVHDLFRYPSSDTVHLVEAREGLNDYDSDRTARWLTGDRLGGWGHPVDVLSFMAAEGKIPFGEYLIVFG